MKRIDPIGLLAVLALLGAQFPTGMATAGGVGNVTNAIEATIATNSQSLTLVERSYDNLPGGNADYTYRSDFVTVHLLVWPLSSNEPVEADIRMLDLFAANGAGTCSTNWTFGDGAVSLDAEGNDESWFHAWHDDVIVMALASNFTFLTAFTSNLIEAVESAQSATREKAKQDGTVTQDSAQSAAP